MNTQLLLLWLLLPQWAIATAFTDVSFSTNLLETQAQALREGKFYFVHFTASWCAPCRWMEENTFADDELTLYVHENYLAVKIDFDNSTTESYKKRYSVTALPSLLIFNAKGILLDRYDTSLSKEELLRALQKNNPNPVHNTKTAAAIPTAAKITHNNIGKISRPALIPDEATPMHQSATLYTNTTPKTNRPAGEKFAIQIGVYSDYTNAERASIRAETRFNQPVKIVEIRQNDKKLYKVMLGKFEERAAAAAYLEQLSAQSIPGFVKNIDN